MPEEPRPRKSRFIAIALIGGAVALFAAILFGLKARNLSSRDPQGPEEQYQLARQLYANQGGALEVARAMMLFERAAAQNHAGAQLKLGVLYEQGIGCSQDWQQAATWYLKAAKQGHPAAQTQLGVLLSRVIYDRGQPLKLILDTDEVTLPDYDRAAEWFHAAAQQDYPPAQLLLGDLMRINYTRNGTNATWLAKRYGKAADWHVKAAEAGLPESALKAAYAYSITGNANLTTYWFYVASQLGAEEANDPLSRSLNLLSPVEKIQARALAKKISNSTAKREWLEWHQLIYLQNPGPAVLMPDGATNSFASLRAAAEAGDAAAQFRLALNLQHETVRVSGRVPTRGWGGEPMREAEPADQTRLAEAVQWYQKAAQQGHADAQFHLACLYRHGVGGLGDFTQAQSLFESAARAGHRAATYELAVMLDEGFAGAARPQEAMDWFKKAAAVGHEGARLALEERAAVVRSMDKPSSSERPARLAILALQPELRSLADLLLVTLTGQRKLELIERLELERILKEQQLGAGQIKDYVKLGQLLRADGLLILESSGEKGNQMLSTRLVATGPGVVLDEIEMVLPLENPEDWSRHVVLPFIPYWPKLVVTARDAVPVSLLNLRAAISMPNEPGLERQLTAFLKHRLLHQPELFVLERSRMEQLAQEKELTGLDPQKFWNGSHLLEGVLNRDGVKAGELGIHLRLTSPSRKVTEFSLSGPADKPEKILNDLAAKVVAELVQNGRYLTWKPQAEAQQYLEEGQWALRQNLFPEAQQAGEAAWALGLRTSDVLQLRIQAYASGSDKLPAWRWKEGESRGDPPLSLNEERLEKLLLALALYSQATNGPQFRGGSAKIPPAWLTLGGGLVHISARNLKEIARESYGLQKPFAPQLARVRLHGRELIRLLTPEYKRMEQKGPQDFLYDVVYGNALFHDDVATAAEQLHQHVLSGLYRQAVNQERDGRDKIPLLAVWDGNPKGKEILYKTYRQIFDQLQNDPKVSVQEDVMLGRMKAAISAYEFEDYYRAYWDLKWNNRETSSTEELKRAWNELNNELSRREDHGGMRAPIKQLEKERTEWDARMQPWVSQREAAKLQAEQKAWFAEAKKKNDAVAELVRQRAGITKTKTPEELQALYRSRPTQPQAEPVPVSANARLTLGRVTQSVELPLDKFWMPPSRFPGETNEVVTTILAVDTYGQDVWLDVSRRDRQELSRHWLRFGTGDQQFEMVVPPAQLKPEMLSGYLELERRARDLKLIRLGDQLYRLSRTGLLRYSLKSKEWEVLPMVLPEYCRLHVAPPHLLASNHEGIYSIDPASRTFKILASTRRRPAEAPLDNLTSLELGDISPLGNDHVVFNVNRRLFLLQVSQRRWSELGLPGNYNGRLETIAGSVLFEMQDQFGQGGYVRMKNADSKMAPFLDLNFFGGTSARAVLNSTGEGMPRWFLAGDQQNQREDARLNAMVLGDSLLAHLKLAASMMASKKEALQSPGLFFLCDPGLIEPVKLVPKVAEIPAAAAKYELAKEMALYATDKFLVVAPDNGAGFWLVSTDSIARLAEKARARLKTKAQEAAVEPMHPWLKKVREERKAY